MILFSFRNKLNVNKYVSKFLGLNIGSVDPSGGLSHLSSPFQNSLKHANAETDTMTGL